MKLTGIAKERFIEWKNENYPTDLFCAFTSMTESSKNALIIDWFDSVGIYIQDWGLEMVDGDFGFDSQVLCGKQLHETQSGFAKTRSESIESAIIKANELFNELNK